MATSISSTGPTTATTTASLLASTNASSNASTQAANRANAQKIITSLGTGSGVDVSSLAQNLTDAERIPKTNAINAKISKNDARISGYSAVSYVMSQVQTAFNALKDERNFTGAVANVTDPSVVTATASASALEGSHSLNISQLAKPQRDVFGSATDGTGFTNSTDTIENLNSLTLSYTKNGVAGADVTITGRTPADIVKELNGIAPTTGVKAQLAYTGSEYKIVLTGNTGANNSFSLNADAGVSLPDSTAYPTAYADAHQAASNAVFKVDGVQYTRSSNLVTDAMTGVTLNLRAVSSSTSTIDLTRDNTAVSEKVKALVLSYNDAVSMLNVLSDPKSTVETYGGTLVGDSIIRTVKDQLRNMFLPTVSARQSGVTVNSLRDLGVSVDVAGVMTLDEAKMGSALSKHFDEVVTAFSKNFNDLGEFTPTTVDIGIAGNASRALTKLLKATGQIQTQSNSAVTQNKKYQEDLAKLQTRMDGLLARYQKQFAAMDSMVGRNNALRTSLKSTFEGMAKQNN